MRRHRRKGGSLGSWLKGAVSSVGRAANSAGKWIKQAAVDTNAFTKKHKLLSRGLSLVPGVGGLAGSVIADHYGYGRRRRVRRHRKRGGAMAVARPVGGQLPGILRVASALANAKRAGLLTRSLQYASSRLRAHGHSVIPYGLDKASQYTQARGWGRKRRVRRRGGALVARHAFQRPPPFFGRSRMLGRGFGDVTTQVSAMKF